MEEIKKVLSIEVDGQSTIKDLKDKVSDLKKELNNLAVGSDEAKEKSLELAQAQTELKAAMNGSIDATGKLDNSYNGLVARMAKLKAEQKKIDLGTEEGKKAFSNYGKEINKINDQLKGLDAQNGVFGRNVGNYANSISQAFGAMGSSAAGAISKVNGLNAALTSLLANPYAAAIAAIIAVLIQLAKAFKRNDDALTNMKKALAPLSALWQMVQRLFDQLVQTVDILVTRFSNLISGFGAGNLVVTGFSNVIKGLQAVVLTVNTSLTALANVIDIIKSKASAFGERFAQTTFGKWLTSIKQSINDTLTYFDKMLESMANTNIGKLLGADVFYTELKKILGGMNELTEANRQIAEGENELSKQRRTNNEQNAEDLKKIQELQIKIADRNKYTAAQRKKFSKEALKLEEGIAQRNVDIAKQEYEIIKLKNSLTHSNNADLDAESQALVAVTNAETELLKAQEKRVKEGIKITKQATKEQKDEAKETYEALKAQLESEKDLYAERLKYVKSGSEEELNLTKNKLESERLLAILNAKYKIKDEEVLKETLANIDEKYNKQIETAEIKHNQFIVNNRLQAMQNDAELLDKSSKEYFDALIDIKQYVLDNLVQLEDETDEAFNARVIKAKKELQEAQSNAHINEKDREQKKLDNNVLSEEIANSSSLEYYKAELDAAKWYYDNLEQLQDESNEDYERRQLEALKSVKDAEKALNNQRLSNYNNLASGLSDIMSSVAGAWEDSINRQIEAGKLSEEEGKKQFEGIKAIQIAVATIQTIAGAVGAFMGITKDTGGWGIAIAAIEAAAVTAAGSAQIAKIAQTTIGNSGVGGSSGTGGFVLPKLDDYEPQYTQNLTGANDTQNLQKAVSDAIGDISVKAYVVESDITNAQGRRARRDAESTF